MKFRFSIKSLFIITTVIAVLMGIAIRLDLVSRQITLYFLVYLAIVCLFFGPRYFRELREFREKRSSQLLVKASLEEEARKLLAAAKTNEKESQQDGEGLES